MAEFGLRPRDTAMAGAQTRTVPDLTIHDLTGGALEALRVRAHLNDRSVEEEARQLIERLAEQEAASAMTDDRLEILRARASAALGGSYTVDDSWPSAVGSGATEMFGWPELHRVDLCRGIGAGETMPLESHAR